MRFAILNKDKVIENIIIADKEFGQSIGAIYIGETPTKIGDSIIDGNIRLMKCKLDVDSEKEVMSNFEYMSLPDINEISNKEKREKAYATIIYKEDSDPLILWEQDSLTIDKANKVFLEYLAEGSEKAAEIQGLILAAKSYIRTLYPN